MKGVILHPDTGLEPDKDISKEGMDTIVNVVALKKPCLYRGLNGLLPYFFFLSENSPWIFFC